MVTRYHPWCLFRFVLESSLIYALLLQTVGAVYFGFGCCCRSMADEELLEARQQSIASSSAQRSDEPLKSITTGPVDFPETAAVSSNNSGVAVAYGTNSGSSSGSAYSGGSAYGSASRPSTVADPEVVTRKATSAYDNSNPFA